MKLLLRLLIAVGSISMLWFSVFLPQNYQTLSSASLHGWYGWAIVLGFLLAYLAVELASRKQRVERIFGVARMTKALWGGTLFVLIAYLLGGHFSMYDIVGTFFVLGVSGFIAGVAILGMLFAFNIGIADEAPAA